MSPQDSHRYLDQARILLVRWLSIYRAGMTIAEPGEETQRIDDLLHDTKTLLDEVRDDFNS